MSNWCNFCQVWHAAGCNHQGCSTEQQSDPDPMHYITALSNRVDDLALKVYAMDGEAHTSVNTGYAKPDWHYIGPSHEMNAERIAVLESMVAVRDDLLRQDNEFIARCHDIISEEPGGELTLDKRITRLIAERNEARDRLTDLQRQVAILEDFVRVGGSLRIGGDWHEWSIWSDWENKVQLTTHFYRTGKGESVKPQDSVLDGVSEALRQWQAEPQERR